VVGGSYGSADVNVFVSYAGTASAIAPHEVGVIRSRHGSWTLGEFGVQPALGGLEEAPREVSFVFEGGRRGATELYQVWVDPRMR